MLSAYVKIVFRLIYKYKRTHAIALGGLSMGLAVVFTLGAYCVREYSFDLFNKNANRTYQLWATIRLGANDAKTSLFSRGTSEEIQRVNSNVEAVVRTKKVGKATLNNPGVFSSNDDKGIFAGPALFQVFTFPLKSGSAGGLVNPNSIMLSERMAQRYFLNSDPINQIILCNDSIALKIEGVFQDLPQNSSLQFDYVISENTKSFGRPMRNEDVLGPGFYQTFLLLKDGTKATEIASKLPELTTPFIIGQYHLEGIKGMHIRSYGESSSHPFWVFSMATIILLIVVIINFINISITQNIERSKEIIIRKINGASRSSIISLFYIEAFTITAVSVVLALLIANFASGFFQNMLSVNLQFIDFADGRFLFIALYTFVVIVIVSGLYPLLILSKTSPASSLMSVRSSSGLAERAGSIVMAIQLIASTGLIMSIIIITKQLAFLEKDDLGITVDNVITFSIDAPNAKIYNGLRNELLSLTGVENVGASNIQLFDREPPITMISRADSAGIVPVAMMAVDSSFLSTLGVQFNSVNNSKQGLILNSIAAKSFSLSRNLDNAILQLGNFPVKVGGIVEDFNFVDRKRHIGSLAMTLADDSAKVFSYTGCNVYVRVASQNEETITAIRTTCEKYLPGNQIQLELLTDKITKMYKAEHSMLKSFTFFTVIGVAISLFGIVALLLLNISRRIKDLSIRKVLGANGIQLSYVLAKDIIRTIVIGGLLGISISFYFLNSWLDEFAYKTFIGVTDIFISAATIFFAVFIVCLDFIRKALQTSPIMFLRKE